MHQSESVSPFDRFTAEVTQLPIGVKLDSAQLLNLVTSLPELDGWPELETIFPDDSEHLVRLDWHLPGIACEAVGADPRHALPAMAALACLQVSIILVDDLLDEEPDGAHHEFGIGRAANLALALQGAAHVLTERCPVPAERRAAAALALSQMALATARGQESDIQNVDSESAYWQVVRAKSTPFYGAGLQVGALLAGVDEAQAASLYQVGMLFGEAVQIVDDMEDAFATPANSDWAQGRNNLPILYGLTAQYPEKEEFLHCKAQSHDRQQLQRAQEILISCGALGYCSYQLIHRHLQARQLIHRTPLANPKLLETVLTVQLAPLLNLLHSVQPEMVDRVLASLDAESVA